MNAKPKIQVVLEYNHQNEIYRIKQLKHAVSIPMRNAANKVVPYRVGDPVFEKAAQELIEQWRIYEVTVK